MRVATSASEKAWTVPPLFSARSVSLRRPSSSSQTIAPSMNIHRTPFSGRNFEYYSEDGFLSGRFGAATVHGARSRGVITFVKHFALNDQETMRTTVATLSNEQAIREVYLAAFEPSVAGGDEGTLGIMLSMNRVGLVWSGDHRGLVTNVVRGEWGFGGVAITDRSPLIWGICRNIPFALLGILVIVLFYRSAKERGDKAFGWMWLTIVLSFGFYIPVVLWAKAVPMIGMLMIPKTCAYVWTVMIGYNAMKKELRK